MKLKNQNKFLSNRFENIIVLFFFIILTIVGYILHTDYGISLDEESTRLHGFVTLNYICEFFFPNEKVEQSFFGFPILINKKLLHKKQKFLSYLNKKKIETRPILSGNFLNQPSAKLYNLNNQNIKFNSAQEIEDRGFFIGIPSK